MSATLLQFSKTKEYIYDSVQFSHSVISDSLQPHELQHARPPYPSPTPGIHPNSCPSSQWHHLAISSSVFPFSSCPQSLPASVFASESTLLMRWPKYWSFSFSIIPSKEHAELISFRMDWLDLLAVRVIQTEFVFPQTFCFPNISYLGKLQLHSSSCWGKKSWRHPWFFSAS